MRPGKLYFGDNLDVLRGGDFPSESVDLVYLDPPFNSNRDYNVLFQERDLSSSHAQIKAFEDCWHWDEGAQATFEELTAPDASERGVPPAVSVLIESFYRALPKRNDMLAYLVMMTPRLIELRRVLKQTGSLYLHCDPTASHYLKVLLDAIFGPENFRNEIIWKRKAGRGETNAAAVRFGVSHDCLLFYSRSKSAKFFRQYTESNAAYIASKFTHVDESGRRYRLDNITSPSYRRNLCYEYKGIKPPPKGWAVSRELMEQMDRDGRLYIPSDPQRRIQRKRFLDELAGETVDSLWVDIPPINSQAKERLGYPTQKPLALLERVIHAATREGDIVLDPFCGCGTTIEAAQKLGREWIGIDITHVAIQVIRNRMATNFPGIEYELLGEPQDVESARVLAETSPYQFQWWALHRVGARPFGGDHGGREGKMGRDRGIDGFIKFRAGQQVHDVVISVKGGKNIGPAMVRELRGTMERQKAPIGVLLTMQEPSSEMKQEAVSAGFYKHGDAKYPRLQILSVKDLFNEKTIRYPSADAVVATDKQALLPGFEKPPPPPRRGHRIKVPETPPSQPAQLPRRQPKERALVLPKKKKGEVA